MSQNEDYQRAIFSSHLARKGAFKGDVVARLLLSLVARYVSDPCLDVGAGSGRLLAELKARGWAAIGLDLCPSSDQIVCGTITSLPFYSECFRTVFCCDVLEHLADQQLEPAVREIERVLMPGGHLIITTPFEEDLRMNMVRCPKCGHQFHRYGHLQSFSIPRVASLLKAYGLEPVWVKVYALGAMAKLPLGSYFNWFFKRLAFESIGKSIVIVAAKAE